jgi:hypothetical protein
VKLPNGHRALVDIAKLLDYCLSLAHPRGRHKARVFAASLGLTVADAGELRAALLEAARTQDALPGERDAYGTRYVVEFRMRGPAGAATIRSAWIIRTGEDFPRFTSCHVC